jgi:Flp pilus assembly protein protease CpaA
MVAVLFGAVLVFVAISTIYDDIRCGLIRNRRILQGLAAGGGVYAVLLGAHFLKDVLALPASLTAGGPRDIFWLLLALLNAFLGFVTACVLWHFKVWAAGDAKLFTLYCFIIPPELYHAGDVFFPGIILLINVFAFTFLYLVGDAVSGVLSRLKSLKGSGGKDRVRQWLAGLPALAMRWVPLILLFTAMFAGLRAMREAAREGITPLFKFSEFTLFMILFVVFKPLSDIVRKRMGAVIFSVLSLAAMVFLYFRHGMDSIFHLVRPGGFAVLLILFSRAYQAVGNITHTIRVGQLRRGMILARETQAALQALLEKEKTEAIARGENPEEEDEDEDEAATRAREECVPRKLGSLTVDGLTADHIRFIKTRFNDDERILVAQTVPFSPVLALGAFATLIAGRALVTYVMRFFS